MTTKCEIFSHFPSISKNFLPHFDIICDLLLEKQTHGNMEYICYYFWDWIIKINAPEYQTVKIDLGSYK